MNLKKYSAIKGLFYNLKLMLKMTFLCNRLAFKVIIIESKIQLMKSSLKIYM